VLERISATGSPSCLGCLLRQEMALRIAGTNRREGKGYTGALSALMMRDGLYDSTTVTQPAKESFGAVLWFGVKNHRMGILQEILRDMTPGQRARFNSPITARQRVKKIAVERELEEAPKPRAVKQLDAVVGADLVSEIVEEFEYGEGLLGRPIGRDFEVDGELQAGRGLGLICDHGFAPRR
jgi:hypothetical protein